MKVGVVKIMEFRREHELKLQKQFGKMITEYYFFLKERHFKRSKNKFVIILSNQSEAALSKLYNDAEELGLELNFLSKDRFWQAVILLFDNQEDYLLFKLQFKEHIGINFNFQEVHETTYKKNNLILDSTK